MEERKKNHLDMRTTLNPSRRGHQPDCSSSASPTTQPQHAAAPYTPPPYHPTLHLQVQYEDPNIRQTCPPRSAISHTYPASLPPTTIQTIPIPNPIPIPTTLTPTLMPNPSPDPAAPKRRDEMSMLSIPKTRRIPTDEAEVYRVSPKKRRARSSRMLRSYIHSSLPRPEPSCGCGCGRMDSGRASQVLRREEMR